MKTRRGGLRLPQFLLAPASRPTLVDLLQEDVDRDDRRGPYWLIELEVACARQDMGWMPASKEPLPVQARVHGASDGTEGHPAEAAQQR